MKFQVSREDLLGVLTPISKVSPKLSTLPILENLLLEVKDGHLVVTASDMEVMMRGRIEASGQDGSLCVNAKLLMNFVKLSDKSVGIVEFEVNEADVTQVKIGKSKCTISGLSPIDFPLMDVLKGGEKPVCVLPSVLFQTGMSRVLYATSTDDLRPAMMGVNMSIKKGTATLCGTNAHILSTYTLDAEGDGVDVTIPKKAAQILSDSSLSTSDEVRIYESGKNYCALLGGYMLYFRLVDAKYPNYVNVIPTENPITAKVNRDELLQALKRVGLFSDETTRRVSLSFLPLPTGNVLTIEAQDIDRGKNASEEVSCDIDGEQINIGFNSAFLLETLSSLEGDSVRFEMSSPTRGALLYGNTDVQLGLIMPVMLG